MKDIKLLMIKKKRNKQINYDIYIIYKFVILLDRFIVYYYPFLKAIIKSNIYSFIRLY